MSGCVRNSLMTLTLTQVHTVRHRIAAHTLRVNGTLGLYASSFIMLLFDQCLLQHNRSVVNEITYTCLNIDNSSGIHHRLT